MQKENKLEERGREMGTKTENNEQMEQIKKYVLRHTRDWDYADWLLSQIMEDIRSKDSLGLVKAGFTFYILKEHVEKCKNAEAALTGRISALMDDAKKKEDE